MSQKKKEKKKKKKELYGGLQSQKHATTNCRSWETCELIQRL